MVRPYISEEGLLDPEMRSSEVLDFERRLLSKVVGQDRAVRRIVNMYQIYLAGMSTPGRPIGNLLFLGPTGSGKTRVVEASAEILFGSPRAFIKIDCAEFQHSHEIAKLIGSPPGYLGHRETPPLLTQEAIDQYQNDRAKMTFILFDEIEKASDALWQLLLGILDKGTLTLGDNRRVDLSRCVIFMTSNLGAVEMSDMLQGGGIGFTSGVKHDDASLAVSGHQALSYRARCCETKVLSGVHEPSRQGRRVPHADRRGSAPDSRHRTQRSAEPDHGLAEQQAIRLSIARRDSKEFLLREGTDLKYGARHLKRAIERHLVFPLSNLIATGQISQGDVIKVDLTMAMATNLTFVRERAMPSFGLEAASRRRIRESEGQQDWRPSGCS